MLPGSFITFFGFSIRGYNCIKVQKWSSRVGFLLCLFTNINVAVQPCPRDPKRFTNIGNHILQKFATSPSFFNVAISSGKVPMQKGVR